MALDKILAASIDNTISVNAASYTIGSSFIANTTAVVSTGYANVTTSVNSALLTVGSNFIANTTGAYHTGAVNAASFTVGSNFIANSTALTTVSNTVTFGTAAYIVANGNVGIGTAAPRLNSSGVTAGVKSLTVFDSAQGGGGLELMTASTINTASVGRIIFGTIGNTDGSRAIGWIDSLIQGTTANNQGGSLRFATKADNGSSSVAMNLLSTGTVDLPFGQIKFPATQSASSDVNTLDDYEEGTWTPSFSMTGGGLSVTYSSQNGSYIKVGRLVHVIGNIQLSNKTANGSGDLLVSGLPFEVDSSSGAEFGGSVGISYLWTSNPCTNILPRPGTTTAYLNYNVTNNACVGGDLGSASYFRFSITYRASA